MPVILGATGRPLLLRCSTLMTRELFAYAKDPTGFEKHAREDMARNVAERILERHIEKHEREDLGATELRVAVYVLSEDDVRIFIADYLRLAGFAP